MSAPGLEMDCGDEKVKFSIITSAAGAVAEQMWVLLIPGRSHVAESEPAIFKNVCPLDCPDTCSMKVTVKDGVAIDLRGDAEHPFTAASCARRWPVISIGSTAGSTDVSLEAGGAEGAGEFRADLAGTRRWRRSRRGSPQSPRSPEAPRRSCPTAITARWASCRPAAWTGGSSTGWGRRSSTGRSVPRPARRATNTRWGGADWGPIRWRVTECKLIVNWGSNTVNTNSHLWSLMVEARKTNGATIVTVDPYRSPTASRSDWHIAVRPGTDAALALGADARDLARGLQDDDYLERATIGADVLRSACSRSIRRSGSPRSRASTWRPSRPSPAACAREQPSLIRLNYGMQRHRGGGMAVRTIACLPAIIGSWRHPGGGAMLSTSGTYDFAMDRLTRPDLSPPGTRTINMNAACRGACRRVARPAGPGALYVYNSNPAAVAPNQEQGARGPAARRPVHRRP